MAGRGDQAMGDRVSTHRQNVQDLVSQFDDVIASAAEKGMDARIVAQLRIMRDRARRFDEAMLSQAATAVPDGPGLDTVLAGSLAVTADISVLRTELVTDGALARMRDALQLINAELNDYIADGDTAHLTHACGAGLQNLYQVNRHCFGYWQLGNDPARAGKIKQLRLQLDPRGITAEHPEARPVVKLFADGIEGLANMRGRKFTGFSPAEILGPGDPLLPANPARHVPLYIETRGDPPAGCIAALIHTFGDYIAWNDFRIFDKAYPPAMQPDPLEGSPCGVPQLFDGNQYRAEVRRVTGQVQPGA